MYGAKPHQHQSLYHTGRKKKLQQEDRESGGGSIFQYSPVCSTGPRRYPTSSQRTQRRQMTPMSGTWDGWRGGWEGVMKGSGGLMGHKMYCTSLTSALTVTMSFQTWRRMCWTGDRKEPGGKIMVKKVAWEMQVKAHNPEVRRQIDKQNILHVFIICAPIETA